jgi:trehalose synthase-fused probable maltokinase
MEQVELRHLPEFLTRQRWFAGKSEPITQILLVDHAPLGTQGDLIGVIEVQYGMAQPERYLLPVRQTELGLIDALEDPEVTWALLGLIESGRELATASGKIRGERIGDPSRWPALPPSPSVRALGVEQSNTSVVIEDKLILKVLRKLALGESLELEMGRFLSKTRFANTPALLGAATLEGSAAATIAIVHELLPGAVDGWRHALDSLSAGNGEVSPALLSEVGELGKVLGELHAALAGDPEDPAFSPEPLTQADLQRWSSSIIGELSVTLAMAEPRFPELERARDPVFEKARVLARVPASGMKIRQHGDLHLGQVLKTAKGWFVIDFEGEPTRSVDSRREKHSPLRDVAGMLRSFHYAVATAGLEGKQRRSALKRLRQAFVDGYCAVPEIKALLPQSDETLQAVLSALELEKVLYEVRYELQLRPDWARIPVEALLPEEGT